jgi:hypothetical protein
MTDENDELQKLMKRPLDASISQAAAAADREKVRELLAKYLPDTEVTKVMSRLDAALKKS